MNLHLEENPRAWRRFALQVCVIFGLVAGWLAWRGTLAPGVFPWVLAGLGGVAAMAVARPAWCRQPYRAGMIVSAWLGERMGRVVLFVLFFVAVVPLGWILRAVGHDPLALRRRPGAETYWHPVRGKTDLTRMY